jgi:hypothetical protein
MSGSGGAQEIRMDDGPVRVKGHVVSLTDSALVDAGKAQVVEMRFRVDPGYHINSHAPKDEYLIPTVLKLDAGAVKVVGEEYPAGTAFRLKQRAGETLDVYQGEFRVIMRVVAPRGFSTISGTLRYQACDDAACFPPKTLAVKMAISGR